MRTCSLLLLAAIACEGAFPSGYQQRRREFVLMDPLPTRLPPTPPPVNQNHAEDDHDFFRRTSMRKVNQDTFRRFRRRLDSSHGDPNPNPYQVLYIPQRH